MDMSVDALKTYSINHDDTTIFKGSVSKFLKQCQLFHFEFYKYFGDIDIHNMEHMRQYKHFYVDKAAIDNDFNWYFHQNGIWYPEDQTHIMDVKAFLYNYRNQKKLPLPGDIDIIIGGPPCQGISGFNRHAPTEDILKHENNAEIMNFIKTIAFFEPTYVVVENVQRIFSNEDGVYSKYLATQLINMGYQLRMGVLSAACYGAPQIRPRAIIMAARAGYADLPYFPHPTVCPIMSKLDFYEKHIYNSMKVHIFKIKYLNLK